MPKKTDSGNPSDWLTFAEADLRAAEALLEQQIVFAVCRSKLAESIEKLLKADLIHRGWNLRKTHDLQSLLDNLADYNAAQADQLQPVIDELAQAYQQTRYPGFDLAEEDWPRLQVLLAQVQQYLDDLQKRLQAPSCGK